MDVVVTEKSARRRAWNKDKIVGQKTPLRLQDIWAIRVRLQLSKRVRDLALFNLAIDSKLRGCDLVKLRGQDVATAGRVAPHSSMMQQKTGLHVRFEVTEQARVAIAEWTVAANLMHDDYLFPLRNSSSPHIGTRQYARVPDIGLYNSAYGTHTLRRTKASLIYRRTKNLRAVQLLLGHTKLESTVRYLGIEVEDALELAEQTEA